MLHEHWRKSTIRIHFCLRQYQGQPLNGVSEIMAPNNFGSALSKAALKGPLKGPLNGPVKAVIGWLQLISWTSCGVIKSKPRGRRRRRGAAAAEPLIQRRR